MKLVVNFSMLGPKPTGLGVYALNCLEVLKFFKATVISSGANYLEADEVITAPSSIAIGEGKFAAIKRQIWSRQLHFFDALVYSPTHHGLPNQDRQIITLHDLISLRFPKQHYPQYLYFRYAIPRLLKRCAAIFVVSEATRQDVAQTYGYPLARIFVVPNAVDATQFKPGQVNEDNPYLLMVGARYPHKNVDEVLRIANIWKTRYRLVITSCDGKYRKYLEKLIVELGIEHRVEFRNYVDRGELIRLYQECAALIYPSKWEGFGIPPLEALACGRPVIASDIPVHREVLADSAFFVELGNKVSWEAALRGISDTAVCNNKVQAGSARVALYSKDNAVQALKRSLLAVEPTLERR